jgi:protein-export membrane protein SecD/preprotein translocase SecF subunit
MKLGFIAVVIGVVAFAAFPLKEKINLGLDLQGGTYMVLEVHLDEAVASQGERVISSLRPMLAEKGVVPQRMSQDTPGRLEIAGIPEGSRAAADEVFATAAQAWDVSWQAESATLSLREAAAQDMRTGAAHQVKETIDRRINEFGVAEPLSTQGGENGERIVLQLPGLDDAERVKRIITKASVMEFRLGRSRAPTKEELERSFAGGVPDDVELVAGSGDGSSSGWFALSREVVARGDDLVDSRATSDQFGKPVVGFEFNPDAGQRFGAFTGNHVNEPLAIVLDGRVVTYANIQSQIFSRGQLSGRYTAAQAQDEALTLRSGALPARVTILEERTVGPSLGRDSIDAGTRAALAGFAAVMIFLLIWYKGAGVNAVVALLLNIVLVLGLLAVIDATLTLPGIAGLILTMVSAVDANVIIFERIKEEMAAGKGPASAIDSGFAKAFSAIFDSNVTTLLACFFLYNFGSGPIRGFAVTLGLGIIASMFTAIFVSRALFDLLLWLRPGMRELSIQWRAPRAPDFPFMRWAPAAVAISVLAVAVSLALWLGRGLDYGIDFKGGTQVIVATPEGITPDDLRSRLAGTEFSDVSIQRFGDARTANQFLLRILGEHAAQAAQSESTVNTGEVASDPAVQGASSRLIALLAAGGDADAIRVVSSESVGPAIGDELRKKAFWAIASSLGAILVYVAVRFHFNYGLGAIVALAHDVIIAVGVLTLLHVEFDINVIAALLTLAGYSLNDTIVIFDRVRENLRGESGGTLKALLNDSINQSLSRTFLTASTSLLATLSILLFGGPVLKGFALALTIGMIAGTYSTVFVASPVVLLWDRLKQAREARGAAPSR